MWSVVAGAAWGDTLRLR